MTVPETAPPVEVRRALRADLLDVLRIERAAFPEPWPYSAFDRFVGEPGFLVADHESAETPAVVGYVVADVVSTPARDLGHVKDVAVAADHRGEGVATRLLADALDRLRDQGADAVKLEVRRSNAPARGLYEAFDFSRSATVPGYYRDGEDGLVLTRDL
ncbi:MAG: GNAT family N-acetyltransferase [Halobacteriaceae archaeon]